MFRTGETVRIRHLAAIQPFTCIVIPLIIKHSDRCDGIVNGLNQCSPLDVVKLLMSHSDKCCCCGGVNVVELQSAWCVTTVSVLVVISIRENCEL